MKINDQVCSFEQAKKLKELGILPKGYFTYLECEKEEDKGSTNEWYGLLFAEYRNMELEMVGEYPPALIFSDFGEYNEFYNTRGNWGAFTASELQVMIGGLSGIEMSSKSDRQGCFYIESDQQFLYFDTLALALAERLICDLQKGFITASECNERIKDPNSERSVATAAQ